MFTVYAKTVWPVVARSILWHY